MGCNWCDPKYIDTIYIPENETIVTSLSEYPCEDFERKHLVSTSRFIHSGRLNSIKNRLRGLEKLKSQILSDAQTELAQAKSVHDEIEEIYIPAMDFDQMDDFTERFTQSIFKS